MHTSSFFHFFPPPKFLVMKHAGLDISDDALYSLEYGRPSRSSGWKETVGKFGSVEVPPGLIQAGDIKDEAKLVELLTVLAKKTNLSYVKVSVPEEKAYLFPTNVQGSTIDEIRQNIEFKLEENVPLAVADAIFYYDLLPLSVTGGVLRASVSVVPRAYIEHSIELLSRAKLFPISFEIVPKAIARAIVESNSDKTILVLHVMNRKTGIYIVSGGVVSFTSTITSGSGTPTEEGRPSYTSLLVKEIDRVYSYWSSREGFTSSISQIVLVGKEASAYENVIVAAVQGENVPVVVADVWKNTCLLCRLSLSWYHRSE